MLKKGLSLRSIFFSVTVTVENFRKMTRYGKYDKILPYPKNMTKI